MKRGRKHFSIQLNLKDFLSPKSLKSALKNLVLPPNKFPKEFLVEEENFFCAGYFVCYNRKLSVEDVMEYCKKGKWKEIAHLVGDFLILFVDFSKNGLSILTDQTGKFPCFYFLTKDNLYISTSFSEVKRVLPSLSLDLEEAVDYIAGNTWPSNAGTVVKEIKAIPPATLFSFKKDLTFSLTPLLDVDRFLSESPKTEYASLDEFAEEFNKTLSMIISERLSAIGNLGFGADLSSGFDSSLVCYLLKKITNKPFKCYCQYSNSILDETDPKIVSEFAQKHGLDVRYISYDHLFPFSNKDFFELTKRKPKFRLEPKDEELLSHVVKDGNYLKFNGEGGDELYWSSPQAVEISTKFPIQQEYFISLWRIKYHIDRVLTSKGVDVLLDKRRYQKKKFYPLLISPSAVGVNLEDFDTSWDAGVWSITPFIDPRLIHIAMRIPRKNGQHRSKQEIWSKRTDVFTPSQFRKKVPTDKHHSRFLTEKRDFIISLLENSVLTKEGIIKNKEIVSNLKKGNTEFYLAGDVPNYLKEALKLEYFIRSNNIKM